MRKNKFRYAIIFTAILLILFKLLSKDYTNLEWKDSFGFVGLLLLILAMIVSIRHANKEEKENIN